MWHGIFLRENLEENKPESQKMVMLEAFISVEHCALVTTNSMFCHFSLETKFCTKYQIQKNYLGQQPLTRRSWNKIGWTRVNHGYRFQEAGSLHAASGSELGHHNCAPGLTCPIQNPLGARHQASPRWRNEEGSGEG